jgi:hypothetical protein
MLEFCESSSVGRAFACQAKGRGFESRLSLHLSSCDIYLHMKTLLQEEISNIRRVMGISEALGSPLKSFTTSDTFQKQRKGYKHHGVDMSTPSGSNVIAISNGVVIDAETRNNACGGTLEIEHPGGFKSRFCHLKDIKVKKGQNIKKGEIVALSGGGSSDPGRGRSTGPHLHFELKKDGALVDPMKYIDKNDFRPLDSNQTTDSQTTTTGSEEDQYTSVSTFDPNVGKPEEDLLSFFSSLRQNESIIRESEYRIASGYVNSMVYGRVVDENFTDDQCIDSVTIMFKHKEEVAYITYCSIEKPIVKIGEIVNKGDRIGYSDDDVYAYVFNYKGEPLSIGSQNAPKSIYDRTPTNKKRDIEVDPSASPWLKDGPYYGDLSDVVKTLSNKLNPFKSRFVTDPATGKKLMVHKGFLSRKPFDKTEPTLPYFERIKYSVEKPPRVKTKKAPPTSKKLKEELEQIKKLIK